MFSYGTFGVDQIVSINLIAKKPKSLSIIVSNVAAREPNVT